MEAGFPVVVMVDAVRGRKHAVPVTGVERLRNTDGECVGPVRQRLVAASMKGPPVWTSAEALAARQWAQQMVLPYRPDERARLGDAGFPLAVAEAVDARFRAQGYLRRALKHPTPNEQSVRLLEHAVEADPTWEPAAATLRLHQAALAAAAPRVP